MIITGKTIGLKLMYPCRCFFMRKLPIAYGMIEPAILYIKEHFTEPVRLKELADCCNISPNYFHRIFTKALKTTPANYISLLRMNTALPLLLNNEYSIKEIAYQLGFYDDAYFSRVFKNHYGITPGEYRKKRKELLF
ncbi:AraC family transcriptional regulator [Parabacteroides gordonii]|jgi:AraC-like DNA-binding protein|uniref:helix-turn-helix transcriptional regulator n=1 Tax=Parabacteroides gordonii TaxID=574930 RepID=UPI00241D4E24|nr:AraC family transcriptional regulator [Parabacteroides gordonii]